MKSFLMCLLVVVLAGCGEREDVDVTIVKVVDEGTEWGCIGTRTKTIVKTNDNRVDEICGDWGQAGDTIKGHWVSGHWDYVKNGFKTK